MASDRRDYESAKRILADSIEDWCPGFAEGRHDSRGETWFPSPLRPDRTEGSFSVNIRLGVYSDFASGDKGDLLTLYAKIKGISNSAACDEIIARKSSLDREYEEAMAGVDLDDFLKNLGGPRLGVNQSKWMYQNRDVTFYVVRTDLPGGGKKIRPWKFADGKWVEGKPEKPAGGFPILNLAKVEASETVVVVEGEKKSESIPPEYAVTSWAGGAQAVGHNDWTPIRGKKVILWPDNDQPGFEAMDKLKDILAGLGCSISIVEPGAEWAEGDDAGDFTVDQNRETLARAKPVSRPPMPFPLTRYAEMDLSPTSWTIKGVIPDDALASVFGVPGSGKSFFAIDIAACVSTGHPFHGHEVKRPGPVVYIAGEGRKGITKRLRAWELSTGVSLRDAPLFISHQSTSLCSKEALADVLKSITMLGDDFGPVALVIIDTWARNMGGDENSTQDTADAIKAADEIRRVSDCTTLVVHHSGKANLEAGRGSSALFGALDIEYKIERSGKTVIVTCTKIKDDDNLGSLYFSLDSVDLGFVDEDGDEVTSAYMTDIDPSGITSPGGVKPKGKFQTIVVDTIRAAGGSMERKDLWAAVQDRINYEAFKKIPGALIKRNLVREDGDRLFLIG